jgi:hypothetical protein
MKRLGTALVSLTVIWVLAAPASAGLLAPEFLDTFREQTFDGNDGYLDYNGPWVEVGEQYGPESGFVRVWDHQYCDGGYCLKMGGHEGEAAGHGADRAVDLTNATAATLKFDFGRELLAAESEATAVVQVSPDGGDTWTTLKTIVLDKDDGRVKFKTTLVITDFATSDTVIRFKIATAVDLHSYWLVDNVSVEATFSEPPTTTTTQPPTTTTTQPPTTTTTTTITQSPTTTTTQPPTATTTTAAQDMDPPGLRIPSEPAAATTTVTSTTSTTTPPVTVGDVPPESLDTMVHKTALAVPTMSAPSAMPDSVATGEAAVQHHPEPLDALAAEFFTESGSFGGNLLPSIALGVVIAVVSLIGIGSRKED